MTTDETGELRRENARLLRENEVLVEHAKALHKAMNLGPVLSDQMLKEALAHGDS